MHATWTLIGSSLSRCKSGRLTDAAMADGYWMIIILHLLVEIFGLLWMWMLHLKERQIQRNVYYFDFQLIWLDPKFGPFHLIATPPPPIDEVGWLLPPKRNRPKVSTHFSLLTRKRPFFLSPFRKKGIPLRNIQRSKDANTATSSEITFKAPFRKSHT